MTLVRFFLRVCKRRKLVICITVSSVLSIAATADTERFYVTTGVGFTHASDATFTDLDCESSSPAALYGCGTGTDGERHRSVGDFRTVGVLDLGMGFVISSGFRMEVRYDNKPDQVFRGRTNFLSPERMQSVRADLSVRSVMLVGIADLPSLDLPVLGSIRPFVGAGLGSAQLQIGTLQMTFPRTTTIVPKSTRTDTSRMVMAGFSLPIKEGATLDLAWRIMDMGDVRTGQDTGQVVWRDGRREPLDLELAATRARIKDKGMVVSIRFAL